MLEIAAVQMIKLMFWETTLFKAHTHTKHTVNEWFLTAEVAAQKWVVGLF